MNLCCSYGAIEAVRGINLEVGEGKLVALLGANGAGKSTTLNTIAGLLKPRKGSILLEGSDITGLPAYKVVRRGMALAPEGRLVVGPLSVEENLRLSSYCRRGDQRTSMRAILDMFPRLVERLSHPAGLLSGGEQQMLAVARSLMTEPRVLLLDEPSMGLAPSMVDAVYEKISAIHNLGVSILLVEQNAMLALSAADYAYVMRRGEIVVEGDAQDLMSKPETVGAYLG